MRWLMMTMVLVGCGPNPSYDDAMIGPSSVDMKPAVNDLADGDMAKIAPQPDMTKLSQPDLAQIPAVDMAEAAQPDMTQVIVPDMAQGPDMTEPSCGKKNGICCMDTSCDDGLTCVSNASGHICMEIVICGDYGQSCCTSGAACYGTLICQSDGTCGQPPPPPCGHFGQACCLSGAALCVDAHNVCDSGPTGFTCVGCGLSGQPLCPGSFPCQDGYTQSGNTCVPCGASYQPCCHNPVTNTQTCNKGMICHQVSGGPVCA